MQNNHTSIFKSYLLTNGLKLDALSNNYNYPLAYVLLMK